MKKDSQSIKTFFLDVLNPLRPDDYTASGYCHIMKNPLVHPSCFQLVQLLNATLINGRLQGIIGKVLVAARILTCILTYFTSS